MRIVGGTLRHRIIKQTNLETTRETQDKVREAIFNSIGPYFTGGVALDLFCGSGAMAIEAYSRGIKEIYLNDINYKALACAKDNLDSLKVTNYHLTNLDYQLFLKKNLIAFDYIFLDPPYAFDDVISIFKDLYLSKALKVGTIIVFEMATTTKALDYENIRFYKERTYGKKKVCYYEVVNV